MDESTQREFDRLELRKRQTEILKLEAETLEISRPWWRRANYWISIVPIVVASMTLGQLLATGYYDGLRREIKLERDAARQEQERIERDNEKLVQEQAKLKDEQDGLQKQIDVLHRERDELTSQSHAAATLSTAGVEVKFRGEGVDVRFVNYDPDMDLTSLVHELKRIKNVRWVSFTRTPLTNEHLTVVGDCKSITHLFLDGTEVTNEGIAHLASLKQLRTLSANGTEIDEQVRAHLAKMPQLESLLLVGTKVTSDGEKLIRELLPSCTIETGTDKEP